MLVLRLALCLAGAASSSDLAASPRGIEVLEREFHKRADRMDAVLAEMREIRAAFPGSEQKPELSKRWETLAGECGEFWAWEQELRTNHDKGVRALQLLALTRDLGRARRGEFVPPKHGGALLRRMEELERMKSRAERIIDAYKVEGALFTPLREKSGRALETASFRRFMAGAAGLLAAAGLLFAALVRRARPSADAAPGAAPASARVVAANFELVRPLGRGSMGEVYEALDKTLDRRVALKRLRAELLQDPRELERLLNEARVMAALKHPNMVAIYGVERDGGQVYLALEYVDGRSLAERLGSSGRLAWADSLHVLEGAGAAVDYAHGRKVIHRDLKPANIMLSTTGEVKVMDFGIAYQAAKSVSRLTRAPSWGTPPYMAPEQELGGVSAAVDVYALAVCLYEMLTGELPFKGPNFLAQKREALWAAPSGLVPDLPAGIDAVFATALAPETGRRYPSAADLVAACRGLSVIS
ncbi:MAG: serine/threonine protein kinase [Elusimicrobia bacterium]|nr:serine/threonine protein kinase [Elusimicrobiota bacterium]